jgi:hypothetical protein
MSGNPTPEVARPDGVATATNVPASPAAAAAAGTSIEVASPELVIEITSFLTDCKARYRFNNAWDVTLTVLGILLSIAVVAAGFAKKPIISALLGAIVAAVVTAQKAFPFGQRANFYRLLIGQSQNLITRASQALIAKSDVVNVLTSLRMDFAQQLPRGSSSNPSNPSTAAAPDRPPTEAFPYDSAPRYLIFDHGSNFNEDVVETIKSFDVEPKRTSFQSPAEWGCRALRGKLPPRSARPGDRTQRAPSEAPDE